MMSNTLRVSHGRTFDGRPLATLDGLPGGGAELTPPQLRALAEALIAVADDCDSLARQAQSRKGFLRAAKTYPLSAR